MYNTVFYIMVQKNTQRKNLIKRDFELEKETEKNVKLTEDPCYSSYIFLLLLTQD